MDGSPPFNKQLFANSGLAALFADSPPTGDAFFNAHPPNLAILHEKPEHRTLLWMKCQGASNREIAEQSGYTEPWLSQLFRQPWAQQRMVQIITDNGGDVVQDLLRSAAPDSVLKLIDLRDDPQTPPAVVRASCENLLDRYLGKPKQQIEVQSQNTTNLKVEDLDAEIKRLENEEGQLLGRQ